LSSPQPVLVYFIAERSSASHWRNDVLYAVLLPRSADATGVPGASTGLCEGSRSSSRDSGTNPSVWPNSWANRAPAMAGAAGRLFVAGRAPTARVQATGPPSRA
jgi:hypothetical protein